MRERFREIFVLSSFWWGVGGAVDVRELSRQQCVTRKSSDFKDSFAQWKPSCLSVYLIAGHTSRVTSSRFRRLICPSVTVLPPLLLGNQSGRGGKLVGTQTGTRTCTITRPHTYRWFSCVASNGLLKWLINDSHFAVGGEGQMELHLPLRLSLQRGVFGKGVRCGVPYSTLLIFFVVEIKRTLIVTTKLEYEISTKIKLSSRRDERLWLLIAFMCFDFSGTVIELPSRVWKLIVLKAYKEEKKSLPKKIKSKLTNVYLQRKV